MLYTLGPYSLSCIAITLLPLWCIAIYTGTLFHCAVLPYTWYMYLISTLLYYYIHYDLIPLCCISIGSYYITIYMVPYLHSGVLLYTLRPYPTLLHCHIHGTVPYFHSAALLYTLRPYSTLLHFYRTLFQFAALLYKLGPHPTMLHCYIYTTTLFHSAALPYTWYLISTLVYCYIH